MDKILKKELYNVTLYFFAFVGIQIVGGMLSTLILKFTSGDSSTVSDTVILAQFIITVLTLSLFLMCRWQPVNTDFLNDLTRARQLILLCVVLAIGVILPSAFLEELIPEQLREDLAADIFKEVMENPLGYLVVGISAPIVEEVVFRGAIQRAAMRVLSPWRAIVLSSFLFALMHFNPAQIPYAFLLGLLMGWLCWFTGSIVPGIVVHWTNNTLAYAMYLLLPGSNDMQLADLFNHEVWREALAILLSLVLFIFTLRMIIRVNR